MAVLFTKHNLRHCSRRHYSRHCSRGTVHATLPKMSTRNTPGDDMFPEGEPEWQQQFKELERSMQESMKALRLESDAKHAEMMKLLMKQNQPPLVSSPPPAPPKSHSSAATTSLFHSSAAVPFPGNTTTFPISAAPFNQTQPTTFPTRSSPAITQSGNFYSSNLVYDEYGLPLLGVLPGAYEAHSATHEQTFGRTEQTFRRTEEMQIPAHHTPPGFPFGNRGPPSFLSGHNRGSGPCGDRVWTSGTDYRLRKLKMALFEGEDAYGWAYRVERFFDIQGRVYTHYPSHGPQ